MTGDWCSPPRPSAKCGQLLVRARLRKVLPAGWPRFAKRRVEGANTYFSDFPPLAECRESWDRYTGHPRRRSADEEAR